MVPALVAADERDGSGAPPGQRRARLAAGHARRRSWSSRSSAAPAGHAPPHRGGDRSRRPRPTRRRSGTASWPSSSCSSSSTPRAWWPRRCSRPAAASPRPPSRRSSTTWSSSPPTCCSTACGTGSRRRCRCRPSRAGRAGRRNDAGRVAFTAVPGGGRLRARACGGGRGWPATPRSAGLARQGAWAGVYLGLTQLLTLGVLVLGNGADGDGGPLHASRSRSSSCPYALIAVPVATARFPAMASAVLARAADRLARAGGRRRW